MNLLCTLRSKKNRSLCANCKKIGHVIDDCRWKKEKKVWKPKLPNQTPNNDVGVVQKPDDQEFQMVKTASRRAESPIVNTVVRNSFAALEELEVDVIKFGNVLDEQENEGKGDGDPPVDHG